jgi:hypothetical protein
MVGTQGVLGTGGIERWFELLHATQFAIEAEIRSGMTCSTSSE